MKTSLHRIDGAGETLFFEQRDEAPPRLTYWGPSLAANDFAQGLGDRAIPHGLLDDGEQFDCLPVPGRGFSGHPALSCRREDRRFVTRPVPGAVNSGAGWLSFELVDVAFGIALSQRYFLDSSSGVLKISVAIENTGQDALFIDWLAAATLPVDGEEFMVFDGRWAREYQSVRQLLPTGLLVKENRSGRTSHHAPPFIVAGDRDFSEQAGRVIALHLGWSGNHRILAERLRDGRVQVQAGELFLPGEIVLAPGERYAAPDAFAARSESGLNGLSRKLHTFVRAHILSSHIAAKPRPVHFNTWEAIYFDHSPPVMNELAEQAARLGIQRFVVDDGWFLGRNDDRAGLGDWIADPAKYPDGLGPLIAHVRALGMEFGLWVEPEMANRNSQLLRKHPDWILHVPGIEEPTGRNQHVLDLVRPEVSENIFVQIDTLLRDHPISYLKWDMNRDLSHAASLGHPAAHRQILAVYALIDRLKAAHPHVEIESCSSGGGRADYEILKRTDRIWTSDCNDPLERQRIQRGFSILFPPEVMGAHVGPRQSHTTARSTSIEMRALTAIFGHMGVEGDIRTFTEQERNALADWIALYRQWRSQLHGGTLHRLDVADPGLIAFAVTAHDSFVSAAQVETPIFATQPHLRIPGLVADARYNIRLVNARKDTRRRMKRAPILAAGEIVGISGRQLMAQGLPLPVMQSGEIAVFHLERSA